MRPTLLLSFLIIISSCGQSQENTSTWISDYRNLSFQYYSPWTKLPTLDTKEKTLTGVIDYKDGKSYIIQVLDDISQERLSNQKYLEGSKKTMLQANEKNKLLLEDSLTFHGYLAYRQVYLMYTEKWGLLKQENFIIRTGIEFVSLQILFPTTETNYEKATIPDELNKFDKTVKLNSK